MTINSHFPLIESILSEWRECIGVDFEGYRGHVYRVFNFCLALQKCNEEEQQKIAIAACFHDIGLWSKQTVDYIPPSVIEVKKYLFQQGLNSWTEEIGLMVEMHHKIRTYPNKNYPLVELFRKADLIDFSLGFFKFGLSKSYIEQVKITLPNLGFHKFLIQGAKEWFSKHPFSPPPFIKW